MTYYQVFMSAEDEEQASDILDALLEKKLILGGPVMKGPAKFWWKGEIVSMDYCYILTYTTERLKETLVEEYKKASEEEAPMISLIPFEGNQELLKLIDETLGS